MLHLGERKSDVAHRSAPGAKSEMKESSINQPYIDGGL